MIMPRMKYINGQFECHRAMIIGTGKTRQEAWDNMWAKYYDIKFRRKVPDVKTRTCNIGA